MGSSFAPSATTSQKTKTSRAPSRTATVVIDSDEDDSGGDEMDLFSSEDTAKRKGKAKVVTNADGVVIDGKLHTYHKDFKPQKLPNFTKNKNKSAATAATNSESQLKPNLKSTSTSTSSPRKARPAYLGSSVNPIPITAEPKPKPTAKLTNVKAKPSTSRTSPLHDRSSKRSSNLQNEPPKPLPKARPAYRTAKAAEKTDTDSDSPVRTNKKRSGTKGTIAEFPAAGLSPVADRRIEKGSSFPDLPPLCNLPSQDTDVGSPTRADKERTGKKGTIAQFPAAGLSPVADRRVEKGSSFPELQPLSLSTPKTKSAISDVSPSKRRKSPPDDSDDELGMNSDDELYTRGGPRPFPMSTQILQTISRRSPTPKKARKRLSAGSGKSDSPKARERKEADGDMYVFCCVFSIVYWKFSL